MLYFLDSRYCVCPYGWLPRQSFQQLLQQRKNVNFKTVNKIISCGFVIRRKQSETNSDKRTTPVELDDIKNDTASTSNLVYQNVANIRRPVKGKLL